MENRGGTARSFELVSPWLLGWTAGSSLPVLARRAGRGGEEVGDGGAVDVTFDQRAQAALVEEADAVLEVIVALINHEGEVGAASLIGVPTKAWISWCPMLCLRCPG